MLGDVRQPLLHDAVDDELLVAVELVDRAGADVEVGADLRAPGELVGLRAQGRGQAVVVERGGAQLARQAQQLLIACVATAWVSRSSSCSLGGASCIVASSRSSTPVSAWLASSCRSRARRARSASWACRTALAVRARSASRRRSMRSKAECRRATSALSGSGIVGRAEPGRKSTASMASMTSPSGRKRRRRTIALTSTVASTAATSTRKRSRSTPPGRASNPQATDEASTVAQMIAAFTARTCVSNGGLARRDAGVRNMPSSDRRSASRDPAGGHVLDGSGLAILFEA